jgi:hypothetical protein
MSVEKYAKWLQKTMISIRRTINAAVLLEAKDGVLGS